VMVSLGHRLGLCKALQGSGPIAAHELARRSACAERYAREWPNSQVAGGCAGRSAPIGARANLNPPGWRRVARRRSVGNRPRSGPSR
jgi:hypothetical protein